MKLAAPPSAELSAPFAPVKAPDVPVALELPPAVADETGEPYPPVVQFLLPEPVKPPSPPPEPPVQFFLPEPVKPPSPPPEPQPAYSDEVRQSSRAGSVPIGLQLAHVLALVQDIVAELDSVIEEVVEAGVKEVADAGVSYAAAALT